MTRFDSAESHVTCLRVTELPPSLILKSLIGVELVIIRIQFSVEEVGSNWAVSWTLQGRIQQLIWVIIWVFGQWCDGFKWE